MAGLAPPTVMGEVWGGGDGGESAVPEEPDTAGLLGGVL